MHNSLEDINEYFHGAMTPSQKEAFEKRCASDPALTEELAMYIAIEDHLKLQWQIHKKHPIAAPEKDNLARGIASSKIDGKLIPGEDPVNGSAISRSFLNDDNKVKRTNYWKTAAMAAAMLGVVSVSIWWFFDNQQHASTTAIKNNNTKTHNNTVDTATKYALKDTLSPASTLPASETTQQNLKEQGPGIRIHEMNAARRQQLFATNFKTDILPSDIPPSLQEPLADYAAGHYDDALAGFAGANPDIITRGKDNDRLVPFYIHYYKGQSYLATDHASDAIAELQKAILQTPDRVTTSKVNWYLALAYLKNGNTSEAAQLLQRLAEVKARREYNRKAYNLLKTISLSHSTSTKAAQ